MKLAEYLKNREITATAFAEKLKVNQPTMHRYLNNVRFPNPEMIARIEAATGGKVKFHDWLEQQREHRAKEDQKVAS
ncbi:HTH-XRE domain containing protein [Microcystis phage Mae-JY35]